MKKFFPLVFLLFLSSCYGVSCGFISPAKQQKAQAMYNAFGTKISNLSPDQMSRLFPCYRYGDYVYEYSTLWGKKYILVRLGEAVTYEEDPGKF